MINVQPFKLNVRHPSTDPVFLVLLSLFCTSSLGRTIASINNFYSATLIDDTTTFNSTYPSSFVVIHWLCSRRQWISVHL